MSIVLLLGVTVAVAVYGPRLLRAAGVDRRSTRAGLVAIHVVVASVLAGWFVVGCASVGGFLMAARARPRGRPAGGVALYYGVLLFNLVMTWWIGEMLLLACGVVLHLALAALLRGWRRAEPGVFIPRRMEARP